MPANNSDITVIQRERTNKMYDMPTWWLFGSWYGWPPISSTWNPIGNITAAKQKTTTEKNNINMKQYFFLFITQKTKIG